MVGRPGTGHCAIAEVRRALLRCYGNSHRDLLWRRTRHPYRLRIAEVILQQTQVERGKECYQRFLQRFPSVTALARAELDDVLRGWAGLGYYAPAKRKRPPPWESVACGVWLPGQDSNLQFTDPESAVLPIRPPGSDVQMIPGGEGGCQGLEVQGPGFKVQGSRFKVDGSPLTATHRPVRAPPERSLDRRST